MTFLTHHGFFVAFVLPAAWAYDPHGVTSLAESILEFSMLGDMSFIRDELYLRKVQRTPEGDKIIGILPITENDLLPLAQALRKMFGYDLFPVKERHC